MILRLAIVLIVLSSCQPKTRSKLSKDELERYQYTRIWDILSNTRFINENYCIDLNNKVLVRPKPFQYVIDSRNTDTISVTFISSADCDCKFLRSANFGLYSPTILIIRRDSTAISIRVKSYTGSMTKIEDNVFRKEFLDQIFVMEGNE